MNPILGVVLVVGAGIVLGMQYLSPDPRVIGVLVAMLVFGIAWRLDMLAGIGLLVITLPYPRGTTFGSTNLALILLLLVIWLLRVSQHQSPAPRRTPLDPPIVVFVIAWIGSFYNIRIAADVPFALQNTELLVAGLMLFYLVVSNVRTEAELRRLHGIQLLSLTTICLIGLYELTHPGGHLIPGWIEFGSTAEEFGKHNVRVGGPFFDYELLAEFAAISLLLVAFWLVRTRSGNQRLVMGGLFLVVVFILFTTVTRGAMISLAVALLYLAWMLRRQIRLVPFTLLVSAIVAGFIAMNFYVSHYTRSGDILARLMGTEIKGFVPDSRTAPWKDGWDRWMMSPLLGHGPYYSPQVGTHFYYWPHNGYLLVANYVGAVGLAAFGWILFTLFRITRPLVARLDDPSYARSYLVIANTQLLLFAVDQTKIDFLRNPIYQFQVWLLFATWAAGAMVARSEHERATAGAS